MNIEGVLWGLSWPASCIINQSGRVTTQLFKPWLQACVGGYCVGAVSGHTRCLHPRIAESGQPYGAHEVL